MPHLVDTLRTERIRIQCLESDHYQTLVKRRIKQRRQQQEASSALEIQKIASMLPTAVSMVKFQRYASPTIYDHSENYRALSKQFSARELQQRK